MQQPRKAFVRSSDRIHINTDDDGNCGSSTRSSARAGSRRGVVEVELEVGVEVETKTETLVVSLLLALLPSPTTTGWAILLVEEILHHLNPKP